MSRVAKRARESFPFRKSGPSAAMGMSSPSGKTPRGWGGSGEVLRPTSTKDKAPSRWDGFHLGPPDPDGLNGQVFDRRHDGRNGRIVEKGCVSPWDDAPPSGGRRPGGDFEAPGELELNLMKLPALPRGYQAATRHSSSTPPAGPDAKLDLKLIQRGESVCRAELLSMRKNRTFSPPFPGATVRAEGTLRIDLLYRLGLWGGGCTEGRAGIPTGRQEGPGGAQRGEPPGRVRACGAPWLQGRGAARGPPRVVVERTSSKKTGTIIDFTLKFQNPIRTQGSQGPKAGAL